MIQNDYHVLLSQIHNLQRENEQIRQDNVLLVREVCTLRELLENYYAKHSQQKKQIDLHEEQMSAHERKTETIINFIKQVEKQQRELIEEKFKGLSKDVFYKKMETVEKKLERKKQECDDLTQFKDKINRLYLTWGAKGKNPTCEELYKWVYNQIIRNKPMKINGRKKKSVVPGGQAGEQTNITQDFLSQQSKNRINAMSGSLDQIN